MKTLISQNLLDFLISKGYRYCLSKTIEVEMPQADVCIMLTPIKYKTSLKRLASYHDTFFSIKRKPVQMAGGVDSTLILLNMSFAQLRAFICSSYLPSGLNTA